MDLIELEGVDLASIVYLRSSGWFKIKDALCDNKQKA